MVIELFGERLGGEPFSPSFIQQPCELLLSQVGPFRITRHKSEKKRHALPWSSSCVPANSKTRAGTQPLTNAAHCLEQLPFS